MATLYDKLVAAHTVRRLGPDEALLYVSQHVMNEYTSPQAFAGLAATGRSVWRPEAHLGVVDHVNSTRRAGAGSGDEAADLLIRTFAANCQRHGIRCLGPEDDDQGIEHVIIPEQGLARPGQVIACGDSHTTTYGAFGALGFGIGTSEVEHVLATQTLVYRVLKNLRVTFTGAAGAGVTAKDLVMAVIRQIGASGAHGHAVEFRGAAIDAFDLAGRMTVCNMAVEMGARAALIAPDATVIDHLRERPHGPDAAEIARLTSDLPTWRSDADAVFDREVVVDAAAIAPLVTWGTSPDQAVAIDQTIPDPTTLSGDARGAAERALAYMGLEGGRPVAGIPITMAFIGSCTNARIEDLRAAAALIDGRRVATGVRAIVVPGSRQVLRQAEAEGLAARFRAAGFDWRSESGCSMCLAMNDDVATADDRIASSTNRNFEGRQGRGSRTHLMSPAMVAAAAIAGHLVDARAFAIGTAHA